MADNSKYDSEVEPLGGTRTESRNNLRAVNVDANHRLEVAATNSDLVAAVGNPAQAGEAAAGAAVVKNALGGQDRSRPQAVENDAVTATGTTAALLAENANRAWAVIVNRGAEWAYLGIGEAAVANKGISLAPNGGSYEINANNWTGAVINVIADASTVVTYCESTFGAGV